jgi:hypothetical protein
VEKALIERARAAGLGSGLGELELLARLRHHGAATRLLDCSRNAFVALWFACRWEPDQDGVLIGFELGGVDKPFPAGFVMDTAGS